MENITAVKVTSAFADLDKLNGIYTEAFPPEERRHTLPQMLESSFPKYDVSAYYCDGNIIGLSVRNVLKAFTYLFFFAVSRTERSNGYGGKIFDKIVEDCGGRPLVFAIEDPTEECDNKEQRVRREAFYLKHNCVYTGYKVRYMGNDSSFCLMSSRKLDNGFATKIMIRVVIAITTLLWAIWKVVTAFRR